MRTRRYAVPRVIVNYPDNHTHKPMMRVYIPTKHSETTTTATTLSACGVGWGWCDILDTANLHTGTGESAESGLSTWTWGLGTVTCRVALAIVRHARELRRKHTTSGSDLDVESGDSQFLASGGNVLGSQHSGVWGGLVTVGLDLHATSHTGDGFTATGITHISL